MLCGPVAAVHPRQGFLSCQLWFREHALFPRLSPLFVVFFISLELPAHFFILVSRHSVISLFIKVQLLLIECSLTLFIVICSPPVCSGISVLFKRPPLLRVHCQLSLLWWERKQDESPDLGIIKSPSLEREGLCGTFCVTFQTCPSYIKHF